MVDPDIRLDGHLICFSISHVIFLLEGPKSLAKLCETKAGYAPALDPPLHMTS